ncbi:MAG: gliding motility-associated C-terminal domain-containing protein [Bacteroidota bacterium]
MIKFKNTFLLLFVVLYSHVAYSQNFTIQYFENFEDAPDHSFLLNSGGGTGTNFWFVNDEYDGNGVYPNTPPQDSTGGTIGQIGNPGGSYLHIKDLASSALNSNYNPNITSVRWAELDTSFCTFGFTRIVFNFWWLAKASPADYGEVYYSLDGGATWTLATSTPGTGSRTKYNAVDKWNFSSIEDPAFLGLSNLTFAFKWTNDNINTNDSLPFSIDDIMLVAFYENYDASSIEAVNFISSPICHEDLNSPEFWFTVNDSLCAGVYVIEMSDSAGDFTNSTFLWSYQFTLPAFDPPVTFALPSSWGVKFPTSMPFGSCYTFRVVRLTPPIIIGEPYTVCIEIIDCPDNMEIALPPPAVLQDPYYDPLDTTNMPGLPAGQQPVCIYSVIDVKFFSYGAFNPGNEYYLELSDSTGSFDDTAYVMGGPLGSTQTFDPAIYPPPVSPGSISGQIPIVPPGCNYYLRIVSTNPALNDTVAPYTTTVPWGPFCIMECDIKTNEAQDTSVCITDTNGVCFYIPVDINTFDSAIFYNPGNEFIVQLLSPGDPPMYPPAMTIVNEGDLGILFDTVSGQLEICIPPIPDYYALGLQLGMYYMRIIATDGSDITNLLGSVIRLTIGGVSGIPLIFEVVPSAIVCDTTDFLCITIYNAQVPSSEYIIQFEPGFLPFTWTPGQNGHPAWPTICFTVDNFPSGSYSVTVQEKQSGGDCWGPISDTLTFTVDLMPEVQISGPDLVCVGDTVTYSVNFTANTFYEWGFDADSIGEIIVHGNNEITVAWKIYGSVSISIGACNKCDNDVSYCDYNEITVTVLPNTIIETSPKPDTTICEGQTIKLTAANTEFGVDNQFTWISDGVILRDILKAFGGDTLIVSPDSTTSYIVKVDNGCPASAYIIVRVVRHPDIIPDHDEICLGDSTQLNVYVEGVIQYVWNPSQGLSNTTIPDPVAYPVVSTDYTVTVTYDSICPPKTDTFTVIVNDLPVVNAGNDTTIFLGDQIMLNASGGIEYVWIPATGLDNTDVPNPLANPDTTTTYIVTITDETGCVDSATITIEVIPFEFEPEVPDAFTPDGDGLNDILYVYDILGREGEALEDFNFKIFNRWGEMIFETSSIDQGWDGRHMKTGKDMEVGVYTWLLTATTIKDVEIGPVSGNVTLIR